MGALTIWNLEFIFNGAILIGASTIFFGTVGMPSIEAPLWTPSCKLENKCAPLGFTFSVYVQGSWTFGQTICFGNAFGNPLGTWWELDEDTLGTRGKIKIKTPPTPPLKRKKQGPSWVHAEPSD
jgi:hypothetical protein